MAKLLLVLMIFLGGLTAHAQQTIFVPSCSGVNDTARFTTIIATIGANTGTIKIPYKANSAQRCALGNITIPANIALDNTDGTGIYRMAGNTVTVAGAVINPVGKTLFYGPGSSVFTGTINGVSGQVLSTDGAGLYEWVDPSGGGGGAVDSVFGRVGTVTAQTNDYTWAQINKAISSLADITTRNAADLNSGILSDSRLSINIPRLDQANTWTSTNRFGLIGVMNSAAVADQGITIDTSGLTSTTKGLRVALNTASESDILLYGTDVLTRSTKAIDSGHQALTGHRSLVQFSGAGRLDGTFPIQAITVHNGTGYIQDAYGVYVQSQSTNNGGIPRSHGVYAELYQNGAANNSEYAALFSGKYIHGGSASPGAVSVYGLKFDGWAKNTSTVGTSYGIYMDSSIDLGTTRYALFSSSTSPSILTGDVAIGGQLIPRRQLDVLDGSNPQLRLTHTDNLYYTDFAVNASGSLTVSPIGNLSFDPFGNQIDPVTNYDINLGQLNKKYLTLHAAELWVETLVAQNTLATIGGRVIVAPTNQLTADLSSGSTTIQVKYNNLLSGDRVYMEANGSVEFMAVTSGASGGAGAFTYTVTRNLDGTGANDWFAGDALVNTGTTGSGFIDLYSVRGVKDSSQIGPTIVGNIRNSSTYNDWTEHWAIGNLNGLFGYGSNTPGVGLGKYAAGTPHMTFDPTNGIRIFDGLSTVVGQWANTGAITVGQVAAGQSNVLISAGQLDMRTNLTSRIRLTSAGVMTINDSAGTAKITLDASAGMTLDGKLRLEGASSAIAIGTTPPTSASAGTGIWIDRTGMYGLASGTVQAKFDAVTGKITAGAGNVKLGVTGLEFAAGTGGQNAAFWIDPAVDANQYITAIQGARLSSPVITSLFSTARMLGGDTTGLAQVSLNAQNDTGVVSNFTINSYGSAHATLANQKIAAFNAGTVLVMGSATPTASAALDVQSTTGAFIPPRMTNTQRNSLTPSAGMVIWNTTDVKLQVYTGSAWADLH